MLRDSVILHLGLLWVTPIGSSWVISFFSLGLGRGGLADLQVCRYIIVTPNQLTAAALVIQYWVDRDKVNPGVWIAVFLVTIIFINYFGIRFFGEFEFWLSSKYRLSPARVDI